jgi:hypothetical protein
LINWKINLHSGKLMLPPKFYKLETLPTCRMDEQFKMFSFVI